jgi:hypothetical protein
MRPFRVEARTAYSGQLAPEVRPDGPRRDGGSNDQRAAAGAEPDAENAAVRVRRPVGELVGRGPQVLVLGDSPRVVHEDELRQGPLRPEPEPDADRPEVVDDGGERRPLLRDDVR